MPLRRTHGLLLVLRQPDVVEQLEERPLQRGRQDLRVDVVRVVAAAHEVRHPEQRPGARRQHAVLHGALHRAHRVLRAVLAFADLAGRGADDDQLGDAAGQLPDALLDDGLVEDGLGRLRLRLQLLDALQDEVLVAAADDGALVRCISK
jgi:hypothetical protein